MLAGTVPDVSVPAHANAPARRTMAVRSPLSKSLASNPSQYRSIQTNYRQKLSKLLHGRRCDLPMVIQEATCVRGFPSGHPVERSVYPADRTVARRRNQSAFCYGEVRQRPNAIWPLGRTLPRGVARGDGGGDLHHRPADRRRRGCRSDVALVIAAWRLSFRGLAAAALRRVIASALLATLGSRSRPPSTRAGSTRRPVCSSTTPCGVRPRSSLSEDVCRRVIRRRGDPCRPSKASLCLAWIE